MLGPLLTVVVCSLSVVDVRCGVWLACYAVVLVSFVLFHVWCIVLLVNYAGSLVSWLLFFLLFVPCFYSRSVS